MSLAEKSRVYDFVAALHAQFPLMSADAAALATATATWQTRIDAEYPPGTPAHEWAGAFSQQQLERRLIELASASPRSSAQKPVDRGVVFRKVYPDGRGDFENVEPLPGVEREHTRFYTARSPAAERQMLIKYLRETGPAAEYHRAAGILAEYRRFNVFRDPNVVNVYDAGWLEDDHQKRHPFVAMERLDARTLYQWRNDRAAPPTLAENVAAVQTLAAALGRLLNVSESHVREVFGDQTSAEVKLMHLDIKPDNVMVLDDADGRPQPADAQTLRLIDFGSAGTAATALALGTDEYAAPERFHASPPPPNPTWDVFALGGVLYFLHTGKNPPSVSQFTTRDWSSWLANVDLGDTDINLVFRKCLAYDHRERYASARELAEDLFDWLRRRPLRHARRYSWWEREKLLIERCRKFDRLIDQTTFIGQASLLFGGILAASAALYAGRVAAGFPACDVFLNLGSATNTLLFALTIACAWVVGFRRSALKSFLPLAAVIVAMSLTIFLAEPANMLKPTIEELNRAVVFAVPVMAVFMITQACSTPLWSVMQIPGWLLLALSPVIAALARQSWFRDYTVVILLLAEAAGTVNFAAWARSLADAEAAREADEALRLPTPATKPTEVNPPSA